MLSQPLSKRYRGGAGQDRAMLHGREARRDRTKWGGPCDLDPRAGDRKGAMGPPCQTGEGLGFPTGWIPRPGFYEELPKDPSCCRRGLHSTVSVRVCSETMGRGLRVGLPCLPVPHHHPTGCCLASAAISIQTQTTFPAPWPMSPLLPQPSLLSCLLPPSTSQSGLGFTSRGSRCA